MVTPREDAHKMKRRGFVGVSLVDTGAMLDEKEMKMRVRVSLADAAATLEEKVSTKKLMMDGKRGSVKEVRNNS